MESIDKIKFYGALWCGDCVRAKFLFDIHHIDYEYIDIDKNPEAEKIVLEINKGMRSIPVIVFPDGTVFVEPRTEELAKKLGVVS
jgi:mycoredoxin